MKLNKKEILGEAVETYRGNLYGGKIDGLAEECVDLAQLWVDTHSDDFGAFMRKKPKDIKKELKDYIRPRVSYSEHNTTFLPTFIWMWVAHAVVLWVVGMILRHIEKLILKDTEKDEDKYL